MAKRLGIKHGTCYKRYGRLVKLGPVSGESQPEAQTPFVGENKDEMLRNLRESGHTWAEISTRLGIPKTSCSDLYQKLTNWTKSEDELLVSLRDSDVDWKEASEQLGKPVSTCQYRYARLKNLVRCRGPVVTWTRARDDLLVGMREFGGLTYAQISERLGVHQTTCRQRYRVLKTAVKKVTSLCFS